MIHQKQFVGSASGKHFFPAALTAGQRKIISILSVHDRVNKTRGSTLDHGIRIVESEFPQEIIKARNVTSGLSYVAAARHRNAQKKSHSTTEIDRTFNCAQFNGLCQ